MGGSSSTQKTTNFLTGTHLEVLDLPGGQKLELYSCIGGAQFGRVYNAKKKENSFSQPDVIAVKKIDLSPSLLKKQANFVDISDELAEESNQEIRRLAEMNHTNIGKYYHGHRIKNHYYIEMEKIIGQTLESHLSDLRTSNQKISEKQCIEWFLILLDVLKYLKTMKIIHYDIKPSNLMLSDAGIVKLVDFGISPFFERKERIAYCADQSYQAPEITNANPQSTVAYTEKCDIWSLGCVMYQILTMNEISPAGLLHDDPCLLENTPEISDEFFNVLSKMLDKNVDTRIDIERLIEDRIVKTWKQRYGH